MGNLICIKIEVDGMNVIYREVAIPDGMEFESDEYFDWERRNGIIIFDADTIEDDAIAIFVNGMYTNDFAWEILDYEDFVIDALRKDGVFDDGEDYIIEAVKPTIIRL